MPDEIYMSMFDGRQRIAETAAHHGHLPRLMEAHVANEGWGDATLEAAASDQLACLVYAHLNGAPWDVRTTALASENGSLSCLKYAHEHGCPWDYKTVVCCAQAYLDKMANICHFPNKVYIASDFDADKILSCLRYARDHECE